MQPVVRAESIVDHFLSETLTEIEGHDWGDADFDARSRLADLNDPEVEIAAQRLF
jgi:hypothetical protein